MDWIKGGVRNTLLIIQQQTEAPGLFWSELYEAIIEDAHEHVELLLTKQENFNRILDCGDTPLTLAIKLCRTKILKIILACGKADVNGRQIESRTPLHCAIQGDHFVECFPILLEYKCDIDALSEVFGTPLMYAVNLNKIDIVKTLLLHEPNINCSNDAGQDAFYFAKGSDNLMEVLLQHAVDKGIHTALHGLYCLFARTDKLHLIKLLSVVFPGGVNTDVTSNGDRPLHLAVENCFHDMLKLLLDINADMFLKNKSGHTAEKIAEERNDTVSLEIFRNWKKELLASSVTDNDKETVTKILSATFDANARYDGDDTILHIAASSGEHVSIIKKLIANGCKVNATNKMNHTPLQCALMFECLANMNALLRNGADIEQQIGSSRQTVLHLAVMMNNLQAVKMLLQNNAFVDAADCSLNTPLIYAIEKNCFVIFKYLLKSKASCRITAHHCYTPIVFAIRNADVEFVRELLLTEQACADDIDIEGNTPLMWAVKENHLDMVKLLIGYNADATTCNNNGESVMSIAESLKHKEILDYLQTIQNSSSGHDVMLSYQWNQQHVVKKIKECLVNNGVTVWMDIERMHDEINDRMAEAVFHSKIIILCMSQSYVDSLNCKKEFNYADKMNKFIIPVKVEQVNLSPGTALDLVIGNKLYYCLYDEEKFVEDMKRLTEAVKLHLHNSSL